MEPTYWTSVNKKTCNESANNINTWFIQPSTFNSTNAQNGSNAIAIRNTAWDLNGTTPADFTQTWGTLEGDIYNHNEPSVISNRSAGKMFLGSYSFLNNIETYKEGIAFHSRPSLLKGYYIYSNDNQDTNETGTITLSLYSGENIVAEGHCSLSNNGNDYAQFSIPITYNDISKKATILCIMIASSNHASYDQSDENILIKTTNYNSKDESCSRGAQLTIDNLTFTYD